MQIYKQYSIPHNLQLHQLRVASVAAIIADNYTTALNKDDIIKTCLFHDMGNIIKFDLNALPGLLEPESKDYWSRVQQQFIKKYGADEHEATLQICEEIGLSPEVIGYIDRIQFSLAKENYQQRDLHQLICHYSDSRVGPYGVVSLAERMEEAKKRYENHINTLQSQKADELRRTFVRMETYIQKQCSINLHSIDEQMAEERFEKHLELEI